MTKRHKAFLRPSTMEHHCIYVELISPALPRHVQSAENLQHFLLAFQTTLTLPETNDHHFIEALPEMEEKSPPPSVTLGGGVGQAGGGREGGVGGMKSLWQMIMHFPKCEKLESPSPVSADGHRRLVREATSFASVSVIPQCRRPHLLCPIKALFCPIKRSCRGCSWATCATRKMPSSWTCRGSPTSWPYTTMPRNCSR